MNGVAERAVAADPHVAAVRLRESLPWWLLALFVAAAITFALFPQMDLAASRLFTNASGRFPLQHDLVMGFINRAVHWGSRLAFFVLLALTIVAWRPPRVLGVRLREMLARRRREILFLFVALALGPGLVVNTVLKDNSGRMRPVNVIEFGGSGMFTGAFARATQCPSNCAFVSGHAAVSTFPSAGWFIARSRRARRGWLAGGVLLGLTVGSFRVMTGSHFLSDVVMAMIFVWIVTALCAAVLLRRTGAEKERQPGRAA